jgi:hypothetical protein
MKLPPHSRYPKSILVKDEQYSVQMRTRIGGTKTTATVGECDSCDHVIRVLKSQSKEELFSTFIHELLHASSDEYDIKLTHRQVYKLERAIAQILLNNFITQYEKY